MSARRKARKRALDVLFAADLRGVEISEVLEGEQQRSHPDPGRFGANDYATELISGVAQHIEDIDSRLCAVSTDWPLERLAGVDRAILRIAAYEILFRSDIPAAVAVSEAGELAQEYSTDDSRQFVQGVLGAIVKGASTESEAIP